MSRPSPLGQRRWKGRKRVAVAQADPKGACRSTRGEAGGRSRGHLVAGREVGHRLTAASRLGSLSASVLAGSVVGEGFCRGSQQRSSRHQ